MYLSLHSTNPFEFRALRSAPFIYITSVWGCCALVLAEKLRVKGW
jgi:hypothetical protein